MLQGIEEVQIFLLANPEEDRQLSEPNLIGYALIKLSKCGGMYAKSLERWNKVLPNNRKKWAIFRKHMINEYELKITEGGGTTMGQEFRIAMHATDTNTEEDSPTEAVTKYAERETRAEANMAEIEEKFEERFAMLYTTAQQPQTYAPPPPQYPANPQPMQTAYFTTPPPTVHTTTRNYPRPLLTITATISAIQRRQEKTQRTWNEEPRGRRQPLAT